MAKPLAGKRFFHALGVSAEAKGQRLYQGSKPGQVSKSSLPLWARNAFMNGYFGLDPRRCCHPDPERPRRRVVLLNPGNRAASLSLHRQWCGSIKRRDLGLVMDPFAKGPTLAELVKQEELILGGESLPKVDVVGAIRVHSERVGLVVIDEAHHPVRLGEAWKAWPRKPR